MREKIKNLSSRAKAAATAASDRIGAKAHQLADLNGDGKVDAEDARIAAERAGRLAKECGNEAARVGKDAIQTDLGKRTATGAAIGAAAGTAVPIVGTVVGAAIGAGVGAYHSLASPPAMGSESRDSKAPFDLHAELLKLDELRQHGVLTEEEFQERKRLLLSR